MRLKYEKSKNSVKSKFNKKIVKKFREIKILLKIFVKSKSYEKFREIDWFALISPTFLDCYLKSTGGFSLLVLKNLTERVFDFKL